MAAHVLDAIHLGAVRPEVKEEWSDAKRLRLRLQKRDRRAARRRCELRLEIRIEASGEDGEIASRGNGEQDGDGQPESSARKKRGARGCEIRDGNRQHQLDARQRRV